MTTETVTAPPPLGRAEKWLLVVAVVVGAGVGALGLVSSFDALSAAAERWGFSHPWILPVGIDAAIPTFTLANLLLIRMDMRLAWVRAVPWVLTLVTCWLNIAAGGSLSAKVAHGTMPLLWVVLSEIVAHVYAVRIGAVTGRRMERVRRSRWFLAPFSTFALWRRMVLWEVTSYRMALGRERERQLARADLRETYGRGWRRKAPRRERMLLKLGELAPEDAEPTPVVICERGGLLEVPAVPPAALEKEPERPKPKRTRKPAKAKAPARRSDAELVAEAREKTADWAVGQLTADRLRTTLRIAPDRARALRDTLRAERQQAPNGVESEAVAA
ncbi:DUF2637 domain-containing protein [Streptomyces sp. DSM 44915]|uniref:DUF2637 domain-containing protein n=1 Tax=Streptomyces chisholmiae TaxID=3075540 RepID=A0ABU2JYE5_9ACTN|nr:DUF2637 domain-containing protein [Streptomyces sp. DSM 44915]MDT0270033.1 DUF2637 domain-containing protein [Streptomyces sp. DSM 44915]